jgi:hypothetical protein
MIPNVLLFPYLDRPIAHYDYLKGNSGLYWYKNGIWYRQFSWWKYRILHKHKNISPWFDTYKTITNRSMYYHTVHYVTIEGDYFVITVVINIKIMPFCQKYQSQAGNCLKHYRSVTDGTHSCYNFTRCLPWKCEACLSSYGSLAKLCAFSRNGVRVHCTS